MQHILQAADLSEYWLPSFEKIKVLSLDCFDTVLWRKVIEPTDVFYALANTNEFKEIGLTATLRIKAESAARRKKWMRHQSTEVTLEEIYTAALPGSDASQIAALAALELASEIQHGFIFKPVADLIRQAKVRGLQVVIVSDTYLSEAQLRKLLFSVMPELESLIDAVFCSSDYGVSKSGGIWKHVLSSLKVQPAEICHLGDNIKADLHGAQRFGIQATHLLHQRPEVTEILEQRPQVAVQLLPNLRHSAPAPSYFHAQFASMKESSEAAFNIGYVSLGPILYAFADFVLDEIHQLSMSGKRVKAAFLMRDGFLPSQACAALQGAPVGSDINISRFTSIAASLYDKEQVLKVLENSLGPDSMPALLNQFLLPEELTRKITRLVQRSSQPEQEFARLILQNETLKVIFNNSLAFRKRLIRHIQRTTGVESGDTLMFVDLGYSGTAQSQLQDILKQDLNVDLVGRYLIAGEVSASQKGKKGLLDPSWVDARITAALTGDFIAAFEMMCTQSMPSTIDYTEDGAPIYANSKLNEEQHKIVEAIQKSCLQFISDLRSVPHCHRPSVDRPQLAQSAAIDLARLLYFPVAGELDCLKNFQFDFNLGTDIKMPLFDLSTCLTSMHRQGFMYMNADFHAKRTNYPMELRHLDISLATLLFSQNRYGFGITPAKSSFLQESIPVLVANETEHLTQEITAHATYNGYFSLLVPMSARFSIGILLGRRYSWIQIDSIQMLNRDELYKESADLIAGQDVVFDAMTPQENGLFELNENGMLYLFPLKEDVSNHLCRLIFRPIASRQSSISGASE